MGNKSKKRNTGSHSHTSIDSNKQKEIKDVATEQQQTQQQQQQEQADNKNYIDIGLFNVTLENLKSSQKYFINNPSNFNNCNNNPNATAPPPQQQHVSHTPSNHKKKGHHNHHNNHHSHHHNQQQQQQQQQSKYSNQNYYKNYLCDTPQAALLAMRKGNNEYYKERYYQAIELYNTAITLSASSNPLFLVIVLINRSISKLRIQDYKKSIIDSTLAISIQPNCIKAYICRSFGYFFTKDFKKAITDHLIATHLIPSHLSIQKVMRYAHGSTFIYNPNFNQNLSINEIPEIKNYQLEWLSDFHLLSIEEEPCRLGIMAKYMQQQIQQQNSAPSKAAKDKTTNANQTNIPPSLIPSGEFTFGTLWSDLEEYYSFYQSNISESLASKQKLLGNADFQDKNYLAALCHYSKAIKLNPEDSIYYSNRGIVYYKLSRYFEAITDCSISIEKQTKQIKAYLRRGSSYLAIGDFRSAVKDFKLGLKYEPESVDLIEGLYKATKLIEQDIKNQLAIDPKSETLNHSFKLISIERSFIEQKLNYTKLSNGTTPPQPPQSVTSTPTKEDLTKNVNNNNNKTSQPLSTNTNLNKKQQQSVTPTPTTTQVIGQRQNPFYKPITKEEKDKYQSDIKFFTYLIESGKFDSSEAYLGRAEAYLLLSDFASTLSDYEKALFIDPKNPKILKRFKQYPNTLGFHVSIQDDEEEEDDDDDDEDDEN
ncbi:hypothetical protein CYY_003980 [Polysphondylium violaceum]|uniref:Uncharacterized protein n=1 Tax=Polysphondylium violaceum TaxID=133409 RepID=A0A8J4PXN0_9MYCE|nr:hypothetical protein CYY_003980 [Polysphondylium violaceum]